MLEALMGVVSRLQDTVTRQMPSFSWATVTSLNPLRIRLEGEEASLPITPGQAYQPTHLGQKVYCVITNRRVVILAGKNGLLVEQGVPADRLWGAGFARYDHKQGYLLKTDIKLTDNRMWVLKVEFNTYSETSKIGTGTLRVQGHAYGNESGGTLYNCAALSSVGRRDVYVFYLDGFMHIWIPVGPRFETAHFSLSGSSGTMNRSITYLSDAAMPSSGISRTVAVVPEVIGYKPQAHATFTYSGGSTAGGASRVLATGTITINKPSMVFFSGNFQAMTDINAAAWFDVEMVGVGIYPFRIHSYDKAIHTAAAWSRGFNVAAAGTYTVRVVARVDTGGGNMRFEDIHAEVWTF